MSISGVNLSRVDFSSQSLLLVLIIPASFHCSPPPPFPFQSARRMLSKQSPSSNENRSACYSSKDWLLKLNVSMTAWNEVCPGIRGAFLGNYCKMLCVLFLFLPPPHQSPQASS